MRLVPVLREIGNRVYDRAFPIYVLCYRAFKAYADRAERKLLRRTLSPGDVAVDVGANIGIYTQLLSRSDWACSLVRTVAGKFQALAVCHAQACKCALIAVRRWRIQPENYTLRFG